MLTTLYSLSCFRCCGSLLSIRDASHRAALSAPQVVGQIYRAAQAKRTDPAHCTDIADTLACAYNAWPR